MRKSDNTSNAEERAAERPRESTRDSTEYLPIGGTESLSERRRIDLRASARKLKRLRHLWRGIYLQNALFDKEEKPSTRWTKLDKLWERYKEREKRGYYYIGF